MGKIKAITWCRWKRFDPYDKRFYTLFTITVLKPSFEFPIACIALSIVNTGSRTFMRFTGIEDLQTLINVPVDYLQRLQDGFITAKAEAKEIQDRQRTLMQLDNLPPGTQVIRTDTGEVLAEAERIINGNSGQA